MSDRSARALASTLTVMLAAGSGALLASPGEAATASARANTLVASLAGTSSGDPDGSGSATIRLMRRRGEVCAILSWRNIQRPSAAHIHRASDGAVVVDLTAALADGSACNSDVSRTVIRAINADPRAYYVNVHNATHPGGSIQGSLHH